MTIDSVGAATPYTTAPFLLRIRQASFVLAAALISLLVLQPASAWASGFTVPYAVQLHQSPITTRVQATQDANTCPADGSLVAVLTRQAFDEGREPEGREYGAYLNELAAISVSGYRDQDIVDRSIVASINFAKKMQERGHTITLRDLIIHREAALRSTLRSRNPNTPIFNSQLDLQLAVIKEMKRLMCR